MFAVNKKKNPCRLKVVACSCKFQNDPFHLIEIYINAPT